MMDIMNGLLDRFSPHEFYRVVANVPEYKEFVPWCADSAWVHNRLMSDKSPSSLLESRIIQRQATLAVGFKQFREQYTSHVTLWEHHADKRNHYRVQVLYQSD